VEVNQSQARVDRDLWLQQLFQGLVVAVLVGCVAWSVAQLLLRYAPGWSPGFLTAGSVLAALEAALSYRLLRTPRMLGADRMRFRTVELVLLFFLLKIGWYISHSEINAVAHIQGWHQDLSRLFDVETLAAFLMALMSWAMATQTVGDLDRIGEPPERDRQYISPTQRLRGRFFIWGVVLLIAAGLSRVRDPRELIDLGRPAEGVLMLNVPLYFFLGLVVLGQARFFQLRTRWEGQELQVAQEMRGRWMRYSLAFIGLAALLAVLLPTGFTLGLLNPLADSLGVVGAVLYFLSVLFFSVLLLPFAWLYWLMSMLFTAEGASPAPRAEIPRFELPEQLSDGGTQNWFDILWPLIFWGVLVGVVVYVVYAYLRDRPEVRDALRSVKPLQALRRAWKVARSWMSGLFARVSRTVSERLPRRGLRASSPGSSALGRAFRFFRLGSLSPRERVLYYYWSIVRRADQQGLPRLGHQTPNEYSAKLESNLPEGQPEIRSLTEAFVEARYSRHEVEPDEEQRARASWDLVKRALRALKRGNESEGSN
jgi:hypothetical protein